MVPLPPPPPPPNLLVAPRSLPEEILVEIYFLQLNPSLKTYIHIYLSFSSPSLSVYQGSHSQILMTGVSDRGSYFIPKNPLVLFSQPKKVPVFFRPQKISASFTDPNKSLLATNFQTQKDHSYNPISKIYEWSPWGLSVCPSVYWFVSQFACCLSVCLSVCLSLTLSLSLPQSQSLYFCLCVCLWICLSLLSSLSLSFCLFLSGFQTFFVWGVYID